MQSARRPQFALLRPLKMICRARLRGRRSLPRHSQQQAPSSSCQQVLQWTRCPGNMWDLTAPSARCSPSWACLAASRCVVGHHCGQHCIGETGEDRSEGYLRRCRRANVWTKFAVLSVTPIFFWWQQREWKLACKKAIIKKVSFPQTVKSYSGDLH